MWVRSLGREDSLEKEMATHFSILAWRIPWAEKPWGLKPIGLQRVGHNWSDLARTHACIARKAVYNMIKCFPKKNKVQLDRAIHIRLNSHRKPRKGTLQGLLSRSQRSGRLERTWEVVGTATPPASLGTQFWKQGSVKRQGSSDNPWRPETSEPSVCVITTFLPSHNCGEFKVYLKQCMKEIHNSSFATSWMNTWAHVLLTGVRIWGFLEISLPGRHIWRKALSQNIEGKSEKVFGYLKQQQQQNILYNSLRLFATPWTVAYQTPLSMEISRQEYWSGLPFNFQGIFSTCISCITHRFFTVWATREALYNSQ